MSCKSGDNGLLGQSAASGYCAAPDAGQVIAIGAGDALDEAEIAQARELAGNGRWRQLVKNRNEMSTADAGDVESGSLKCAQQTLLIGP